MKEKLTIALVQAGLQWENIKVNLRHMDNLLVNSSEGADMIILPEMFSTGFTMNVKEVAEPMDGLAVEWMKSKAKEFNAVITGSLIIHEDGQYFNRLIWAAPGQIDYYDKRHLFRMQGENKYYSPGKEKRIFTYHGWRICPMICYDLRFPVWSRNRREYDFLFYVANWPAKRNRIWDILLPARAIENQVYVAGVNRVGKDGMGIEYTGNSCLINPKGEEMLSADTAQEDVLIKDIDFSELERFRKKFPVGEDADNFEIRI